ncbi:MAG: pirin family protein [Pseudomonadota bacterium]
MRTIRLSAQRGRTVRAGLEARHAFSFGQYLDPQHSGLGPLRALNEEWIAPAVDFDSQGHADMEIVTLVLSGKLAHSDSVGGDAVLGAGDVQRVTAGSGIRLSQHNPSSTEGLHLLQIWIVPERDGLPPSVERLSLDRANLRDGADLLASQDGGAGGLTIHADVQLTARTLTSGEVVNHQIAQGRGIWIQVIRGSIDVDGDRLMAGDGICVVDEPETTLSARSDAEFLLIDLAL